MSPPPFHPFAAERAAQKARLAEDAWNSRDSARHCNGYSWPICQPSQPNSNASGRPDSPTLPIALLAEMVDVLSRPGDRAVLGPSTDGGYYLLASKTLHPHLFKGIAWSTEAVFAQTLERAAEIGLPVHILPEWYDIDDAAMLRLLAEELLADKRFSASLQSSPAPNSTALLETMFQAANLGERLDRFLADSAPNSFREAAA